MHMYVCLNVRSVWSRWPERGSSFSRGLSCTCSNKATHNNYTEPAPVDTHKSALKKHPTGQTETQRETNRCTHVEKKSENEGEREMSGRSISEQRNVISMNMNNHPSNYQTLVQNRFWSCERNHEGIFDQQWKEAYGTTHTMFFAVCKYFICTEYPDDLLHQSKCADHSITHCNANAQLWGN